MNRKLKALGLALVAALALTAVMASTASAQYTSNKTHTILSGSQKEKTNDIFSAGEGFGGITCENATFSGTSTNTNEASQVIQPNYQNCKDSFGRTVDVDNGDAEGKNKLTYTFTTTTLETEGGPTHVVNTVHVSGLMTLTVTSGGSVICTVVIKSPQTNNGISYTNLGGTSGVETTTHATNVISTTSGGFFNCGVSNGEHKKGTYDGTAVVTGKNTAGEAASISVDIP
ncbi:MAG TPA: hypothetical protein VFZ19_03565 [Solirubrobacterales bacterium]